MLEAAGLCCPHDEPGPADESRLRSSALYRQDHYASLARVSRTVARRGPYSIRGRPALPVPPQPLAWQGAPQTVCAPRSARLGGPSQEERVLYANKAMVSADQRDQGNPARFEIALLNLFRSKRGNGGH